MTTATLIARRGVTAAVLLVGGGAVAAATWASGDHGLVVFYVLATGVAYLWSGGKGDVAAIMRVGGDERQRKHRPRRHRDHRHGDVNGRSRRCSATWLP